MQFGDKKSYDKILHKFWGQITEMITGPDHEYVYLRRILARFKDHSEKREKVYLRRKAKFNNALQSIFWNSFRKTGAVDKVKIKPRGGLLLRKEESGARGDRMRAKSILGTLGGSFLQRNDLKKQVNKSS